MRGVGEEGGRGSRGGARLTGETQGGGARLMLHPFRLVPNSFSTCIQLLPCVPLDFLILLLTCIFGVGDIVTAPAVAVHSS